jgi:hypothetical protein
MNKKSILILLLAAALVATWAFAMHPKRTPPSEEKADQAAEFTLEEMPALPHTGEVRRPTPQQTAEMLAKKGLTLEDLPRLQEMAKERSVPVPADADVKWITPEGVMDQGPLTYCTIHVIYPSGLVDEDGDRALWGWPDPVYIKTWNDAQFYPEKSNCGYPIYPFEIEHVEIMLSARSTCTVVGSFDIQDFVWDHGSPYPGSTIAQTPVYEFNHPGAYYYLTAYFDPPICVYDRFFVGFTFYNNMDFDPTNPEAKYHFALAAICGKECFHEDRDINTYWSYDDWPSQGVWWHGSTWWLGNVRLRAAGYTVDQNDCPIIEDQWWQKESFFWYDEETEIMLAYAPCGLPDFPQWDRETQHPGMGPFDGPTALANCLWWMAAADTVYQFWADQNPPNPDDPWDPVNAPFVIDELAYFMQMGDCGVGPDEFDAGLDTLVKEKVLWVDIKEMHQPTWEFIEYEVRKSEDIILLLGFWYHEITGEPPETSWYRIGGHWVTAAGVDHVNGWLKISDPDLNWAEMINDSDFVCSFSYYIPHDHVNYPLCHYDAGNTSHDRYPVAPSVTPCGELMLIDYPYDELDLSKYLEHNSNPYCPGNVATELPPAEVPIYVQIEFAKSISPINPYRCEEVDASRVVVGEDMWTVMTKCNYGRMGAQSAYYGFCWYPYSWPQNYPSALFDGSIVIGNQPSNLAFYGADNDPPGELYPYTDLESSWDRKDGYTLLDSSTGSMYYSSLTTRYFHNYGLDLDIDMMAVGFWDEVDYGAANGIWETYTITNTGTDPITGLKFCMWQDWNVYDAQNNLTQSDSDYSTIWCFDPDHPDTAFGCFILPTGAGIYAERAFGPHHARYIHPNAGWGWDRDTLYNVMFGADHNQWHTEHPDSLYDHSTTITTNAFDLLPGESIDVVTWTGEPVPNLMKGYIKESLYFIGFFRGDCNHDYIINLVDIVYLIKYVLKRGIPAVPFVDQGDVNYDGEMDLVDITYLVNYLFRNQEAPIDYPRFDEIPFAPQPGVFTPGHPLEKFCQ